jgi:hypothetical protein
MGWRGVEKGRAAKWCCAAGGLEEGTLCGQKGGRCSGTVQGRQAGLTLDLLVGIVVER